MFLAKFGGYGYDDFEGRDRYKNMADKSAAAMRREEEAKKKFKQARERMERHGAEGRVDLAVGTKHTVELLKPSCHLTDACWKSFLRHVRSHEGWVAKRREATAEQKKQHKETRKGKVYFVDVIFSVPKSKEKEKRAKKDGLVQTKLVFGASVESARGSSKAESSGGSEKEADEYSDEEDEITIIESSEDEDEAPIVKKAKLTVV